ncbi:hypothetical protein V6N13_042548 [Hibiscus sabdariffa]
MHFSGSFYIDPIGRAGGLGLSLLGRNGFFKDLLKIQLMRGGGYLHSTVVQHPISNYPVLIFESPNWVPTLSSLHQIELLLLLQLLWKRYWRSHNHKTGFLLYLLLRQKHLV